MPASPIPLEINRRFLTDFLRVSYFGLPTAGFLRIHRHYYPYFIYIFVPKYIHPTVPAIAAKTSLLRRLKKRYVQQLPSCRPPTGFQALPAHVSEKHMPRTARSEWGCAGNIWELVPQSGHISSSSVRTSRRLYGGTLHRSVGYDPPRTRSTI